MKHETAIYARVPWELRHAVDEELKQNGMMLAEWVRALIRDAIAKSKLRRISRKTPRRGV